MMGGRVWFVVHRGWRCGFYYQVSVMEKVMVSLLKEGKKKYIRKVCSVRFGYWRKRGKKNGDNYGDNECYGEDDGVFCVYGGDGVLSIVSVSLPPPRVEFFSSKKKDHDPISPWSSLSILMKLVILGANLVTVSVHGS